MVRHSKFVSKVLPNSPVLKMTWRRSQSATCYMNGYLWYHAHCGVTSLMCVCGWRCAGCNQYNGTERNVACALATVTGRRATVVAEALCVVLHGNNTVLFSGRFENQSERLAVITKINV